MIQVGDVVVQDSNERNDHDFSSFRRPVMVSFWPRAGYVGTNAIPK
jgi:hypothetical protein